MDINDIDALNIQRLLEGYEYAYLPSEILLGDMQENVKEIVEHLLKKEKTYCFKYDDELIITKSFVNVISPIYIHNFGSEAISFFDFKKNGAYREIQIPNLLMYIVFIHNTILYSEKIFVKIYDEKNDFIKHSNSYVVSNKEFVNRNDYTNLEEIIKSGEFATRNNKTVSQLTSKERAFNYLSKMSSKLYVLKLDIESFYPNIYTHFLSKIFNNLPFHNLFNSNQAKAYFEFLDNYNMKVNSNQTKGIVSGCFASNIASELLMLCVDYEISNIIKNGTGDTEYIRYVDDFTYFSDSRENLVNFVAHTQKILNKYKLRINHSKTEITENVLFRNSLNFKGINHDFDLADKIWTRHDDFIQIKEIFKKYLEEKKIPEIKVMLTRIATKIENDEYDFSEDETHKVAKYMVNYLLQLCFYDPNLAVNCYKVILNLINHCQKYNTLDSELVSCLSSKTRRINEVHSNAIIQIWHYYLLNKFDSSNRDKSFSELVDQSEKQNDSINPLVLVTFIIKKRKSNKILINYIKKDYEKMTNKCEGNKLDYSIMLSKWWLPILKINYFDSYNYFSFFNKESYKVFWAEVSRNNNSIE